jgi:hypothetical protein
MCLDKYVIDKGVLIIIILLIYLSNFVEYDSFHLVRKKVYIIKFNAIIILLNTKYIYIYQ